MVNNTLNNIKELINLCTTTVSYNNIKSLIDYNSFHLTMFDIDNVHLFNDIQQMNRNSHCLCKCLIQIYIVACIKFSIHMTFYSRV